jgi:uncharacterized membrane protein YsdA (DUF1294 family)
MRPDPAGSRVRPRPIAEPRRSDAPGGGRPDRDLAPPLPAALSWSVLALFAFAFPGAVLLLDLPWWLPAWYSVASVVAFIAYGVDKSAARRGAARVSEQTLLLVGFAGGWPGALVAQQRFRHKTRKRSFRRAFWASVVANLVALSAVVVLLLGPGAADVVTGFLGG